LERWLIKHNIFQIFTGKIKGVGEFVYILQQSKKKTSKHAKLMSESRNLLGYQLAFTSGLFSILDLTISALFKSNHSFISGYIVYKHIKKYRIIIKRLPKAQQLGDWCGAIILKHHKLTHAHTCKPSHTRSRRIHIANAQVVIEIICTQ